MGSRGWRRNARGDDARTTRRWLTAFVVLALVIRLAFVALEPHPGEYAGLSLHNAVVARSLLDGHGFSYNSDQLIRLQDQAFRQKRLFSPEIQPAPTSGYTPSASEMPGVSVLLAGTWAATGTESYLPLQLLQAVLDSAMVLVVFWMSLKLFARERLALASAGLYAAYLPIAALTRIPHVDALAIDATIAASALLLKALDTPRLRWLVAAGAVTGLGVYFRPGLLLLPVLFGLGAIPQAGWRRALSVGGAALLVAVLLLVPWTARNQSTLHSFVPTRTGIGMNLWEGLGEVSNPYGAKLDDRQAVAYVHRTDPGLIYGSVAFDRVLQKRAVAIIKAHPLFYAKLVGRRVLESTVALRPSFWLSDWIPSSTSSLPDKLIVAFKKATVAMYGLILVILGLVSMVLTRERWRTHAMLIAIFLATAGPYWILHVEPRYILPAVFVFLLVLPVGLESARAAVRSRRSARAPVAA